MSKLFSFWLIMLAVMSWHGKDAILNDNEKGDGHRGLRNFTVWC